MHFSLGELVHFTSFFFRLRTVVVVGSIYWARFRLQPSIFRSFFLTYLESVPPRVCEPEHSSCVQLDMTLQRIANCIVTLCPESISSEEFVAGDGHPRGGEGDERADD